MNIRANFVGFNIHAQNVLFSDLQYASILKFLGSSDILYYSQMYSELQKKKIEIR